jgi:hypothetical protein
MSASWLEWRGAFGVALLAVILAGGAVGAHAQDTAHGKTLYSFYCQVCHSPDPPTMIPPFNLIMTAANNPSQISVAAATWPSQMGFIPTTLSASDMADIAAYLGTFNAASVPVPAVEYYNASQDHYFITASAPEIADLDDGVHPGWARTGQSFNVYALSVAGTNPVCRFYIPPAYGDSHFYSASPSECAQVQATYPAFQYESPSVFYVAVPDQVTGACPAATIPVYRLWDDRADTNHRYTTNSQTKQQMVAAGWIAEGYGPSQVIMCAAQ